MSESVSTEDRVRELEHVMEAMADELQGMQVQLQEPPAEPEHDEPKFAPFYPTVQDWVEGHFAKVYVRNLETPGVKWCSQWWAHEEVATRLVYLWEVWELTRDKQGSAAWWNALDHHLPILLSNDGPLARCSNGRHHPLRPLPVEPPPVGWPSRSEELS